MTRFSQNLLSMKQKIRVVYYISNETILALFQFNRCSLYVIFLTRKNSFKKFQFCIDPQQKVYENYNIYTSCSVCWHYYSLTSGQSLHHNVKTIFRFLSFRNVLFMNRFKHLCYFFYFLKFLNNYICPYYKACAIDLDSVK